MEQHYRFIVHDVYDVVAANRFGMEAHRPLIVVQAKANVIAKPLLKIANPMLVISTLEKTSDEKELLLRVRSVSGKTEDLSIDWLTLKPVNVIACTAGGEQEESAGKTFEVAPYGMKTLRLIFKKKP